MRLTTKEIIATARKKITTAVATCPVAKRIRKTTTATNIQNKGDSGNLLILIFMLLPIVAREYHLFRRLSTKMQKNHARHDLHKTLDMLK